MHKLVIKRSGMVNPLVKNLHNLDEFYSVLKSMKEKVIRAEITTPSGLVKDVTNYFI